MKLNRAIEADAANRLKETAKKEGALNEYFIDMTKMCRRQVLDCRSDRYEVFWLSDLENFPTDITDAQWFSLPKIAMPMVPEICEELVDTTDGTNPQRQLIQKNCDSLETADSMGSEGNGSGKIEPASGQNSGGNSPEGQGPEDCLPGRGAYLSWEAQDKIYQKLRKFAKKKEEDRESYEIVLALGLVICKVKQNNGKYQEIYHHAITIPCNVRFDVESGTITAEPGEDGAKLTLDLNFCGKGFDKGIEKVREILNRAGEDPWSEEVKKALRALSNVLNGPYVDAIGRSAYKAADYPQVIYAPALYLRPRGMEAFLHFAEAIGDILKSDTLPIHGVIRKILKGGEDPENDDPEVEPFSQNGCEEILMPLPSNNEQRRIVEVLQNHNLVLVQGPPGTGKTITIANLICHLLSRGERVLVTAQIDRALHPLREKLPKGIAKLCVTQIGDNPSERWEILQKSVDEICDRQAGYNPRVAQSAIEDGQQRRHRCKCDLEKLKKRLLRIQKCDCEDLEIIGKYHGHPAEITKLVASDRAKYSWFADEFDHKTADARKIDCLRDWFSLRNASEAILHFVEDSEVKNLLKFSKEGIRRAVEGLES
ncbi:MAG: AAA family ATPase [Puniceicoccales bacterium]|jgi:hypothetical protein|nr:AAA family ATPase [Puniceicoccales bacterium]